MLRSSCGYGLLSCLTLRAPVALAALPLLAAYAPEAFRSRARGLHVFARTTASRDEFGKVEVDDHADAGDLKKAVIAKLKLDEAPNRVRLLREMEGGGAPVFLDSRRALAGQGVLQGSSVLVEVLPPPPAAASPRSSQGPVLKVPAWPPLPRPLHFSLQDLGGVPVLVADLVGPGIVLDRPFFLSPSEHGALAAYLCAATSDAPSMLMLTGPIKSGKTSIANVVLPGLLAARYLAAQRAAQLALGPQPLLHRPVIHTFTFRSGVHAEGAAEDLVSSLLSLAAQLSLPLLRPIGPALATLPDVLAALGRAVQDAGGGLWLILDELGAPIVASPPPAAQAFSLCLKRALELSTPYVRCVGTGSGMVALLQALRATPANGFLLWGALQHVRLGSEPAPAQAQAMAQRLHAAYAPTWPPAAAACLPAQAALQALRRTAHNGVTSPRPALLAHFFSAVGGVWSRLEAEGRGGGALLAAGALDLTLRKLQEESLTDTIVGLRRMRREDLAHLRALADTGQLPPSASQSLVALAALLREAGTGHLLPPSGALLREFVARNGRLSVELDPMDGTLDWELGTRNNLAAMHSLQVHIEEGVLRAASDAVLELLASILIGEASAGGGLPCHAQSRRCRASLPSAACWLPWTRRSACTARGPRPPAWRCRGPWPPRRALQSAATLCPGRALR